MLWWSQKWSIFWVGGLKHACLFVCLSDFHLFQRVKAAKQSVALSHLSVWYFLGYSHCGSSFIRVAESLILIPTLLLVMTCHDHEGLIKDASLWKPLVDGLVVKTATLSTLRWLPNDPNDILIFNLQWSPMISNALFLSISLVISCFKSPSPYMTLLMWVMSLRISRYICWWNSAKTREDYVKIGMCPRESIQIVSIHV